MSENSSDGHFSIQYSNGYATLTVIPPTGAGKKIYADDVINRMKLLNVPLVRDKIIEEIIARGSAEPEQIIEWPDGKALSAKMILDISEDDMLAEITIIPPKVGGADIEDIQIEELLISNGIVQGIDRNAIEKISSMRIYNRKMVVAEGKKPIHGLASKMKLHFNTEHKPFKKLEFGRIDLKELNFIQNRVEGDLLAELTKPVQSENGFTLKGNILEAQPMGKAESLSIGDNCELREDNKVYALCAGNAVFDKGIIKIEQLVTLKNVDYETGNIDFDGSIIIKGDVADGFRISATGTIEISKCVGRSEIIAGRNLILKSGINGDKDGSLSAGGDLYAKYLESCKIDVKGNIFVSEAIMHCSLNCWKSVVMDGGRAEIVGGNSIIKKSLWCRKIGGLYETKTFLFHGLDPDEMLSYTTLLQEIETLRDQLNTIDKQIDQLKKGLTHHTELDGKIDEAEKQLENTAVQYSEKISTKLHEAHKIKREIIDRPNHNIIVAEDIIYSGVTISFDFIEYLIPQNGIKSIIIKKSGDKIIEKGFNPGDPPEIPDNESFQEEK